MNDRFSLRSQTARKSPRRFKSAFCSRAELLEAKMMLAGDVLQNPANVYDVNNDGFVSPRDAVAIVWKLATSSGHVAQASGEPEDQPQPRKQAECLRRVPEPEEQVPAQTWHS